MEERGDVTESADAVPIDDRSRASPNEPRSSNKALIILGALSLVVLIVLAALVGKIAFDDAPTTVAQPIDTNAVPQRYEYMVSSIPDLEWDTTAKELGEGGWDLIFARRASSGDGTFLYECIFQRPIVPE